MADDEMERLIIERRITRRIYLYWDSICRGRPMPEENDIDPGVIGEDWPHCFVLQTRDIDHIEEFNFTYLGEGILRAYQHASLDPNNLFLIGPNAFHLAPHFLHVVTTGTPLIDHNHFYTDNGQRVLFRQCLLPLGKNGKVEAIFGAALFKMDNSSAIR